MKENRHIANLLQRPPIGLRRSIRIAWECVEDDSTTNKTVCADALDGQQGVVQTAKTIRHDEEDRKREERREIGNRGLWRERNQPAACPLDEQRAPAVSMMREPRRKRRKVQIAILHARRDEGSHRILKPDGI